jgi:divalent metal cation (Fe/Co/Zn/Cd) transporter
LFVAALVLVAAARLMKRNVDVLMDRVPLEAEEAARAAIAGIEPAVDVRRLRMRQAGPRQFADVVITVPPGAAVGQGHEAADRVEEAVHGALPGSDVVVHVEPQEDETGIRDRAHAAALGVPQVREVHNVSVLDVGGRTEVSLHLKLPGDVSLEDAHEVATAVERAIVDRVPEVDAVQTHVEPLAEESEGRHAYGVDADEVARVVRDATGSPPRELRLLQSGDGLLVYVTIGLDAGTTLADAHGRASELEELIRSARPDVADVIVHTEP